VSSFGVRAFRMVVHRRCLSMPRAKAPVPCTPVSIKCLKVLADLVAQKSTGR
jgi:hypothetical protein